MSIPKPIYNRAPYLKDAIIIGYRGSIAAGMYRPNKDPNSFDDKDAMAIVIPSIDHYFGLSTFGSRGTKEILPSEEKEFGEWDIVTYELLKFIGLLIKGNPNVLSLLWLDDNMYIKKTIEGDLLLNHRDAFASKQVYHSFCGYAYGQLKRMTHFKFEGYMGTKRKALVEKHGYNTKNAAHCIRLLRMGIEFLNEGRLYVTRKDGKQLLQIKDGEWTLEQVQKEADCLFKRLEDTYNRSPLPPTPDAERIKKLCKQILFLKFDLEEV